MCRLFGFAIVIFCGISGLFLAPTPAGAQAQETSAVLEDQDPGAEGEYVRRLMEHFAKAPQDARELADFFSDVVEISNYRHLREFISSPSSRLIYNLTDAFKNGVSFLRHTEQFIPET